jgi:hypothetical protein
MLIYWGVLLWCFSGALGNSQFSIQYFNSANTTNTFSVSYPVNVTTIVSYAAACCKSVYTACEVQPPTLFLQTNGRGEQLVQGCDESWTSCYYGDLSVQALIEITLPNVGNCTFSAWRTYTVNELGQCIYTWTRNYRSCGNLYCEWLDNPSQINVRCNPAYCPQPANLNSCQPAAWNPIFGEDYYQPFFGPSSPPPTGNKFFSISLNDFLG